MYVVQMISSSDLEESSEVMPDPDSSDDNFMVAYAALEFMGYQGSCATRKPRTIPIMTGIQWVERQLQDDDNCYNMFKMRRSVFQHLHDTLVNDYGLTSTREVCSKEALAMFLWTCGAPQSNRQVKNKFGHSTETVSRKFIEVLQSITRLAANIIKPRDNHFSTVHPRIREGRFWPHFKDCIGAIDGTHMHVTIPLSEQPKYFN